MHIITLTFAAMPKRPVRRATASRDHVREPASDGHSDARIASGNLQLLMRTPVGLRFAAMAQLMERRDGSHPARSGALHAASA